MIEDVVSIKLPVDEELRIRKNRIAPEGLGPDAKRICIVTGTHGDELEGQLVCFQLAGYLRANIGHLKGVVDIYPAINPLGIDSISRGVPGFDLDMNRTFPGRRDGSMPEYIAAEIFDDIAGADVCVDIHASNIFLREIPQIRINELSAKELVPLARYMNVDFVWVHSAATVLESTLAYSLNAVGTRTLVAEMGVGMRLTLEYGDQLSRGLISLMAHLGMWDGPVPEVREPIISVDRKVEFINAAESGIFIPRIDHWKGVQEGEHIGDIVSPLTGDVLVRIESPCDGVVFTLREYPVVDEGSLIARILKA